MKTGIESLNDKDLIYDGYRSNSTSLTIEDIYEKLDILGQKFELVNSRLANMDEAIAGLEEKVEDLWVSCFLTNFSRKLNLESRSTSNRFVKDYPSL